MPEHPSSMDEVFQLLEQLRRKVLSGRDEISKPESAQWTGSSEPSSSQQFATDESIRELSSRLDKLHERLDKLEAELRSQRSSLDQQLRSMLDRALSQFLGQINSRLDELQDWIAEIKMISKEAKQIESDFGRSELGGISKLRELELLLEFVIEAHRRGMISEKSYQETIELIRDQLGASHRRRSSSS